MAWRGVKRALAWLWLAPVLAGCAQDKHAVTEADFTAAELDARIAECCPTDGKFPVELVNFAEANSMWIMPFSRNMVLRDSYLENHPGAHDYLFADARPMDVVLIYNGSRLSGQGGEGYFGHMAVYTGTEAELKALGAWNHPALVPFHNRIRAGNTSIESIDVGVQLATPRMIMEADSAAIFRPTRLSQARKRAAIITMFEEIGRPFDFHFSLESDDVVYCTELVHKALPELNFPVSLTYGRRSVWPDEVAAGALSGSVPLRFRRYVYGDRDGWQAGGERLMAARIVSSWSWPSGDED